MVQLIVGDKGKGKTKYLLDKVNAEVKEADGNIVYLDKSSKHMHELDNKVRLINVSEYPVKNVDQFLGFICGVCSQDYDLQTMYVDSFIKVAGLEDLKRYAAIPSRDMLLTMLAAGLMGTVRDLSICLDLYSKEKENN